MVGVQCFGVSADEGWAGTDLMTSDIVTAVPTSLATSVNMAMASRAGVIFRQNPYVLWVGYYD